MYFWYPGEPTHVYESVCDVCVRAHLRVQSCPLFFLPIHIFSHLKGPGQVPLLPLHIPDSPLPVCQKHTLG